MSLSQAHGPPPPRERAEPVLLGALDAGYTLFDTNAVYGVGHNEMSTMQAAVDTEIYPEDLTEVAGGR